MGTSDHGTTYTYTIPSPAWTGLEALSRIRRGVGPWQLRAGVHGLRRRAPGMNPPLTPFWGYDPV